MKKPACRKSQIVNPATGRCVKRFGKLGQAILCGRRPKLARTSTRTRTRTRATARRSDQILNPSTGRYVSRYGAIGRQLLGYATPPAPAPAPAPAAYQRPLTRYQFAWGAPAPRPRRVARPATSVVNAAQWAAAASLQQRMANFTLPSQRPPVVAAPVAAPVAASIPWRDPRMNGDGIN